MPFFSRVFKHKDGTAISPQPQQHADPNDKEPVAPSRPRWEEAWSRREVAPEEVHELVRLCSREIKSKALDTPFLLLPFRPDSDPRAARSFILSFFRSKYEHNGHYTGGNLQQELRLTEPMVLCSIMKWCWSRLPGGIVTWDVYQLFCIGERDSNMTRHAFSTFIPLSVDSDARKQIILEFFDVLAAIAARAKTNGLGARKLSRLAGWWAFDHTDSGKGFDGGYRSWISAADATSHLFFAYLRSLSPSSTAGGMSTLPRSLEALVSQTEYPPQLPALMRSNTTKVVMIVDSVSPTPFALMRRAKHFEYRDDDEPLQQLSAFEDPVQALTDECRRVLKAISSANESSSFSSTAMESKLNASWSRFADVGFSDFGGGTGMPTVNGAGFPGRPGVYAASRPDLRSQADKGEEIGRPTTPSWADFLSSGFVDSRGNTTPAPLMLPPDKMLPPIGSPRGNSSNSNAKNDVHNDPLEPGELASITQLELDETFWWVWMTSLAGEEPTERKAVFGRCTLMETDIPGARWLVMEEQVKGASSEPQEGAYIATTKKSRFGFTKRGRRSSAKNALSLAAQPLDRNQSATPTSKSSIGPDQHAKIQAAAAKLKEQDRALERGPERRGRTDDQTSTKTDSVFTLQPFIMSEAASAVRWANDYDRDNVRARYLGDIGAGKGRSKEDLVTSANFVYPPSTNGSTTSPHLRELSDRELPALPSSEADMLTSTSGRQAPPSYPSSTIPVANLSSTDDLIVSTADYDPSITKTLADEKPQTSDINESEQHPAYRDAVLQRKPVLLSPKKAATNMITEVHESQPSSPEREVPPYVTPTGKPKKAGAINGEGFKKLFGRRKEDTLVSAVKSHSLNESAGTRVPQSTLGRHMSKLRKKSSPSSTISVAAAVADPPAAAPVKDSPADSMLTDDDLTPESPAKPEYRFATAPNSQIENAKPDVSPVATPEQEETNHAFTQFGHGPVEDVPAFIPADLPEGSVEESPQVHEPPQQQFNTRAAALLAPQVSYHQPQSYEYVREPSPPFEPIHEEPELVHDDESEASIDLSRRVSPVHVQDRWAQIRKNAAERAAVARMSEERQSQHEHSHSQSTRTDDGETSGEETIESRVARIKARVAELTGNMDVPNQPYRRPQEANY